MKQLAPAHDGRHDRREITARLGSGDTGSDDPPSGVVERLAGPLAERVHALAGPRPLRPILDLRTRRRQSTITREGRVVGELAIDVTTVPAPDDATASVRLYRVEVEVAAGASVADLEPLAHALLESGGLALTDRSKFEAGLRARGVLPGAMPDVGSVEVDASMTTGAVALAALRRDFRELMAHEPGTRLGEDAEALHEMRVATRRLRATMKLFADALPARARAYRATVAWLAEALGAVRDVDVQLERLKAWCREMAPRDAEALEAIAGLLRRRRIAARRGLLRALDCPRYDRFVTGFIRLLQDPSAERGYARQPTLATAPDLVRRRMRKVRKTGDDLVASSPATAYHQLRIRGKQLRYALEVYADIYGKPMRRQLDAVVTLHKLLGKHQDAEVAVAYLRELCARRGRRLRPDAIFVIGKIAERYEREAEKLRRRFPKRYRAVRGGRWKKLRRVMEKRRPVPEVALPAAPAAELPAALPIVDFPAALPIPQSGDASSRPARGRSRPGAIRIVR
jgi:CHAD domain-containing protein